MIVTNQLYKDLVVDQLPGICKNQVLCEPLGRNTAPCIAYANYKILDANPDARIVVAPSDHIILDENEFASTLLSALKACSENDWLITLGIKPSRPDTGYGYIQYLADEAYSEDNRLKKVNTFTEKPQLEKAEQFLKSGDYLWNAGIFIWSLASINKAFKTHLPEVDSIFKAGIGQYNSPNESDFIGAAYASCQNISIDYGVMEKAKNVYVLASDFGWSDLGTWGSLYDIREKNENGNTIIGDHVMTYDTTNCIVNVPKDKLVVLQGLEDFIVVENDGVLLVCKKSEEQQIKQFVTDVKEQKDTKYI